MGEVEGDVMTKKQSWTLHVLLQHLEHPSSAETQCFI